MEPCQLQRCWKNNNDAWNNILNDRLFGISGSIEVGGRIDAEFRTVDDFRMVRTGERQIKCSQCQVKSHHHL